MMKKNFKFTILFLFIIKAISIYADEFVYQHEYDAENNRIQTTTPNGEVLKYEYDCLNHLEKIIGPNNEAVTYDYDRNGQRKLVMNNFHKTQYSYDDLQRLREIKQNHLFPIKFNYDKAGRLIELVMPDKENIIYKYDKNGRLASVDGWIEYIYNETGNLKKQKLANGVSTEYLYDSENRVKEVKNVGIDGKILSQYCYSYDECNNCKCIEETDHHLFRKSTKYFYDKLNRLKRAEYSNGDFEAYSYGKMGNRLTFESNEGLIQYEYDSLCQLRKAGSTQFSSNSRWHFKD